MPITPEQLKMIADASANLPTFKRIPRAELEKIIAEEWDADEKEQAEFESGGMSSRFEGQTVNPQAPAEREARRQDALAKAEQGRRELEQGDDFFSKDTWTGIKSGLGGGGFISADSEGFAPGVAGVYNAASDLFGEKPLSQLYIEGRDQFRDEVAAAKENPNFYAGQAIGGIAPMLVPVGTVASAASKGSGILASAGKGALMGFAQGAFSGALTPGERGQLDSMQTTLGDAAVGGITGAAVGGAFGGLSGLNTKAKEAGGIVPLLKQNANALADFAESPKSGRQIVGGWLRKFAGDQASEDFVPSADDFFKPTQAPSFKEMDTFKKAQSAQQTPKPPKGGSVVQYDDLSSSSTLVPKGSVKRTQPFQSKGSPFQSSVSSSQPDADFFIPQKVADDVSPDPSILYKKPIGPEQPTFKQLEQYDNAVKRRSALEMQQNPSPSEEVVAKANALKDELTAIRAAGGPKPSQRMSARDAMNLDEPPIPTRGVEKTNAGRRGGPTPQKPNPDIDKSFAEASEIIKNKPVDEIPAAPKPEPPKPKQHGGDRSRFADQVRPEGVKIKDQHYVKPPKSKSNEFVDFFDGDGQYIGNFEVPKGLDDAGKKAILKRWAEGIKKGKGYDPLDGEDLANITFTPGGKMTTKHRAAMSTFKKKDK